MGTSLSKFGQVGSGGIDLPESTSAIGERVNRHYNEISQALNAIKLMPLLSKEGLLDFNDKSLLLGDSHSPFQKASYILNLLESKGSLAYSKFLQCVSAEESHMGHQYIAAILQEKCFGSELEVKESSKIKLAVQKNNPKMMDISLETFVPLLFSKNLLTDEEKQKLLCCHGHGYKTEWERILLLLQVLDTKGPTAYSMFADCLKSELCHPTHKMLYTMLICPGHTEQKTTTSRKRKRSTVDECALAVVLPRKNFKLFRQWKLEGALKGSTYNEMKSIFQTCSHNGDWETLELEAKKFLDSPVPEYQVVAYLEMAISWTFRRRPDYVLQHVDKAREIIKNKIHGENYSILLGRCELILSRRYRYGKDYAKAREHVANAKEHLYHIEAGEDSALVYYHDACIMAECLEEFSTQDNFERVVEMFGRAISDDRSHESGIGIVAPQSLMRLAQMYLSVGATYYTPGTAAKLARNCLNAVVFSSLPQRPKCHYHLRESALHRNCGNTVSAKKSLDIALSISQKCDFELESMLSPKNKREL